MSSIEERRSDMIHLVSGAFQGTQESANRKRDQWLEIQKRQEQNIQQTELLKNIWNIPYYRTLQEQNDFLINNADYRIVRNLAKIQERKSREFNNPLLIPKLTRQELTLMPLDKMLFLRMQGIEIGRNQEINDDPSGKYGDYSAGFPARLSQFATQLQHEPTMQFLSMWGSLYKEYKKNGVIGSGFDRTRGQIQQQKETTIVSGTKPFETKKAESVFQPKKTFSQNTLNIIHGIESGSITVPSWFMNNVNWVKSGQITQTEFINAYNFLISKEPEITIPSMPEITIPSIPEVSAQMELTTTNFQVIIKDVTRYSTSLSNSDYKRLKDEMTLEPRVTLVFLNQTDIKPLTTFYKELRKIQKLLKGKVVESLTISPTGQVITIPETTVTPTKPGLMGAGVLGVIGILMLSGFIADHVRKRK